MVQQFETFNEEQGNWVSGDAANSVEALKRQLDAGSYWPYSGQCDVFIEETGTYCHKNVVAKFSANEGLREIEVCAEHEKALLQSKRLTDAELLTHMLEARHGC